MGNGVPGANFSQSGEQSAVSPLAAKTQNFWRSLNLQKIIWALFLLVLPVTSFPYFPAGLGGKTSVRPLSVYPLLILLVLVTLPRLLKKPLPKTFLPLFAFIVVGLMSSILALSYGLESLRGVTVASRLLRSLVTLGIGSAIYLTVALVPRSWEELRSSLRWLYAGFGLALFWGSIQAVNIFVYSPRYFYWLNWLQRFISTRKLFSRRVSGLTYEPKWFAEQICFLLLPWLLGSVLTRTSIFQWHFPYKRLRWITVECVLLAWASVILVFTYSRTGLFILVLAYFLGFLFFRPLPKNPIGNIVVQNFSQTEAPQPSPPRKWITLRRLVEAMIAVLMLVLLIYFAGTQNNYFARLWTFWTTEDSGGENYLEYIAFQQRFVYAETALRMFEAYPVLGVGVGNYAFYFDALLPDRPWNHQPDILRQLTPVEGQNQLITPKNLFAKILAETGMLGISTFLAFVVAVLGCAQYLLLGSSPEEKFWGISGLFGLIIFFIVAFSFDSFAIPNMWVVFGLITAASLVPRVE
ncbi:MAG: O-antigen ligase family protein [Anaerolineales bacterium]|nr:O-antigen ligase family protein [Anaerolineales bacterium]